MVFAGVVLVLRRHIGRGQTTIPRLLASRRLDRFARDRLVAAPMACSTMARMLVPHAGPAVSLGLSVAVRAFLLGNQRLPIGHRDLVVVGMDFAERQEPVAIATIIDEGGLERRLDPRDLGEIDISS